jgi:hypothetical protein
MIIPPVALALALAPLAFQARADDAHHPGKAAKAGKSTSAKAKRTKAPTAKPKKTSAQETWPRT